MIRLLHSPAAQADLVEFYEEAVAGLGPSLAVHVLETLVERCEDLARFPDMGRRRPDLDALGVHVRSLGHDGRTIVYVKRGGALHVVRVLREV